MVKEFAFDLEFKSMASKLEQNPTYHQHHLVVEQLTIQAKLKTNQFSSLSELGYALDLYLHWIPQPNKTSHALILVVD